MPFDHLDNWFPPTTVHPSDLHVPLPSGQSYESLVPPTTATTPGELLDNYYSDRRNVPDWTDPNGVLRVQLEVSLNHPGNLGAPVGSSGLVGKWEHPNGLLAVPVPVSGAELDRSQAAVEFRDRDQGGPSTGPHVAALCRCGANPPPLQGAEDIVLDDLRGSEIRCIIAWPGYNPVQIPIRVISKNGGPMTRFELGERLSLAYAVFFKKVEKERLLPSAAGFYNIALHQGKNRRPDSLGIQFIQLHLVRFRHTAGRRWIADIEIV